MLGKKSIVIPGTNIKLYDGDLVTITNRPHIKWVVHYGWFIFQNVQNHDWYLSAITTGEILPLNAIDLTLISLTTSHTLGSVHEDGKKVNYTQVFTANDAETLNRTFITVDNIAQRDNLDKNKLVDGRLVRVNEDGGIPRYYAWNASTNSWSEVDWGSGGSKEVFYGTTEYWNSQPHLLSVRGYIYVYSDHSTADDGKVIPGIKIGDGTSYLIDMPFIDDKYAKHTLDSTIHITAEERAAWNNKVRCYIDLQDTQHIIFTTK